MKYKIGDVARLLGITSEAIRHYEEQGIISPSKSKSSGYRYYNTWDINVLIQARAYRQFGYSLAETAELINQYDIPNTMSAFSQKEVDIEKEITWNMNLLRHIRYLKRVVSDAEANVEKYRIEYRPAMYRIDAQHGYNLYTDSQHRSLYHAWIDKVPFVFPSALFQQNSLEQGDNNFSFGMVVDEEYAEMLGVQKSEEVAFLPSCRCLYTTIKSHSDIPLSPQKFNFAFEYMRSQGIKLCGDIVSRVVLINKVGHEYVSWHQLWFPIE